VVASMSDKEFSRLLVQHLDHVEGTSAREHRRLAARTSLAVSLPRNVSRKASIRAYADDAKSAAAVDAPLQTHSCFRWAAL
jgi:hypothetical protein